MLTWELKKKPPIQIFDLLPGPEFIAPENKVISVDKPEDAVVNFSWKAVRGSRNYILRLYSSDLKENLLEEWMVSTTSRTINLQKYEEFNEFFWQVYPYDDDNQREGVPSKIGYVELSGLLQGKEKVLTPPRLVITSLTVSGNMVLIKGEADINSELFINGRLVSINMDGTFIDTMNFESMGKKIIHFRLVAPTEIETNITRQVTIFDE